MHPADSSIVGLPQFEILSIEGTETVEIRAQYWGVVRCPDCQGVRLRMKDTFVRILRHANLGFGPAIFTSKAISTTAWVADGTLTSVFQESARAGDRRSLSESRSFKLITAGFPSGPSKSANDWDPPPSSAGIRSCSRSKSGSA